VVHAVSATFERFERMSPPAAGMALLLHVLVAAFLIWAPTHHPDEPDAPPIEVTMEEPPPQPPEPKPEPKPETKPEVQKPPPKAAPPPPQQTTALPGLAPRGDIGPKNTAPPMERGLPTDEPPPEKAEQPKPKDEAPPPQVLEQQALARLAEPPPPPPPPTLEKELPPVEAPPPPVTARDIPRITPPVPEKKPEAPRTPQQHQQAQPPRPPAGPQLQASPLSRLPRNAPSQQRDTQPRSTFVNPADTYAMNTVAESYQHRVVDQVARYQVNLSGAEPTDTIVVRFTIARSGSLLSVAVVQSSGKPAIDRGLITAFQAVSPFPPLPSEIPGDSATFTLAFGPRFKQR
jgi:TonB family protein